MKDLGHFLQKEQLRQNINQQELSLKSGLGRKTLTQLENVKGGALTSLLKVLYTLQRQDVWDIFTPSPIISPPLVAKLIHKQPLRARNTKIATSNLKPTTLIVNTSAFVRIWGEMVEAATWFDQSYAAFEYKPNLV